MNQRRFSRSYPIVFIAFAVIMVLFSAFGDQLRPVAASGVSLLEASCVFNSLDRLNLHRSNPTVCDSESEKEQPSISTTISVSVDDGVLDPGLATELRSPGYVNAIAIQADDKVIVGGRFANGAQSLAHSGFARLNEDGTLDQSFLNNLRGASEVSSVVIQPDQKILIGGPFSSVHGTSRGRVARLNTDGTLDTNFLNGLTGANSVVNNITLQSDGRIIIGGGFSTVNSVARNRLARINSDGSLDTSFLNGLTGANGTVWATLIQADGKVVVVGQFTTVNGTARNRIARLNADGTLDIGFLDGLTGANDTVRAVALQPDGKIVIAGDFSTVNNVTRNRVARLNSDGTLDLGFLDGSDGSNDTVLTTAIQSDGKIIIGGDFSVVNGVPRNNIARLNADGTLDMAFMETNNGMNDSVRAITIPLSGKVLLGGAFTWANDGQHSNLVRFESDGFTDESFSSGLTGYYASVYSTEIQSDGRVVIGGEFSTVDGVERNNIARINEDGKVDQSFLSGLSGVDGRVYSVAIQPDGKIVIGGFFSSVNGIARGNLARLNTDGTLDTSFLNGLTGTAGIVEKVVLQSDNKIIVAGNFISVNGILRNRVARLNIDGTLDTTFLNGLSGANLVVWETAVQSDGKVIVAGEFTTFNNESRERLVRLNTDGTVDGSFHEPSVLNGANLAIKSVAVQPDGKILVGGDFTFINGVPRSRVARFHPNGTLDTGFLGGGGGPNGSVNAIEVLPDLKIIIGGGFSSVSGVFKRGVARLNADGTLDQGFLNGLIGVVPSVETVTLQTDGKIIVGGIFESVNNEFRMAIARLFNNCCSTPNATRFDYDGDGRSDLSVRRPGNNVWYLQRGTAGYTAMEFGVTGDRMVPADYDGDGKTDVAVFRPSNGTWYVFMSQSQTFQTFGWGQDGDMPVPTDRDNDGKADLVIYRESNNTWYTRFANATFNTFQFGVAGDKPMLGDFDGDGIGDVALFRPSNNNWYLLKSSLGFFVQTWGQAGDIPLTGDFDGDGATDQAVFRPSTGQWFLSRTTAGFSSQNWGQAGDIPVAADYDGDGKADVAVFRPSNGQWYIVQSTAGILVLPFGQDGDVPTQAAYIN